MNLLVVVVLAGLWALILLPGLLREHRSRSPLATIDRFERSMGILAKRQRGAGMSGTRRRSPGRQVLIIDPHRLTGASNRARVLRRRRQTVLRLAAAAAVAGLLALALGGLFLWLFTAAATGLLGYLAMLARIRANEAEARRKTHHLPSSGRHLLVNAPASRAAQSS